MNSCALLQSLDAATAVSSPGPARKVAGLGTALCLLLLLPLHAPAEDQSQTDGADSEIDHATLESNGARIGSINIEVANIFDTDNPEEDRRLYRFANRVNFPTRQGVIEDLLLFETGDRVNSRLLDESARLLRARPYVAEAAIRATSYDEDGNAAEIDVFVRDAWSFEPELRFSRNGGENEYRLGLSDSNLLGTGKGLTVYYNSDVDRDESYVRYVDPNVRGSRTRLELIGGDASDGERQLVSVDRPFYALDVRWSAGGTLQKEQRIDSMYDLGEIVDEFRHQIRFAEVRGGYSRGIRAGRATRWLAGFTSDERRFRLTPGIPDPLLLPEDRKLVYPWVGVQLITDDFREMTELNDMGRVEDIPLGLDLTLILGYSTRDLGADRDAAVARLQVSRGWEPGGDGQLFLIESDASARWESGRLRNSLIQASANYYRRNLGRHLFLVSLNATSSHALDGEQQVLLGGDTGLRGYPLRYQAGRHKAVLTVEQRFHTNLYPWRLFRVGYAAFFDAGRVWGKDPRATANRGTLYDAGVGLRLSSPRSSSGTVIHVDLAFPLNRDGDISSAQLLFEAKQSF